MRGASAAAWGRSAGRAWRAGSAWRAGLDAPALAGLARAALAREVDERRPFLWLAAAFGAGVVLYFAADREPEPATPLVGAALLAALAWRAGPVGRALLLGFAAVMGGFAAGAVRARTVEAPVLARPLTTTVTAFVEVLDRRAYGARVLLRVHAAEGLAAGATPRRVRVVLRGAVTVAPGDTVRASLRLSPPPSAPRPGGYDFARDAYFKGIGAVGTVQGGLSRAEPIAVPWRPTFMAWIDGRRNALTDRIIAVVGGADGAVAASLVTGKRDLIPEETNEALRGAGIYHVVSISGLHMVLAAGMVFWTVRAGLALAPGAHRLPVKKIAAVAAILGASAYNLFSGSEVAAERSLIMVAVMFGAVVVDRPALSLRNLAIAALIVMALEPESVVGPSFQMSFAAVGGLIAAFERARPRADEPREPRPPSGTGPAAWAARLGRVVLTTVAATLVAEAATAPFALYHFQRINPYGLIGNTLALPLIDFVVMPAAFVGALLAPFGLDAWVWGLMGRGVGFMNAVARWVAALEGSSRALPAFGTGALLLLVLALLNAVLWRGLALKLLAVPLALAGALLAARAERPDVYADREGRGAAVRGADGALLIVGRRVSAFAADQWLVADGDPRGSKRQGARGGRCDAAGCVAALPDGRAVAVVSEPEAFEEDCARAAIVVTALRAPAWCAALVLDRPRLAATGAAALVVPHDGEPRLLTARAPTLDRPWARPPAAPAVKVPEPSQAAAPAQRPPPKARNAADATEPHEAAVEDDPRPYYSDDR